MMHDDDLDLHAERLLEKLAERAATPHEFVRKPHRSRWAGCAVCDGMHDEGEQLELTPAELLAEHTGNVDFIADVASCRHTD